MILKVSSMYIGLCYREGLPARPVRTFVPDKKIYQDRCIIISDCVYTVATMNIRPPASPIHLQ